VDDLILNSLNRKILAFLPQLWADIDTVDFSVARKSSFKDIVTTIDIEIENRLRLFLEELLPGADYLGEESSSSVRSGLMWIVDPVDGTTNFSKSNPHYCTQVALYKDEKIVLAVTYDHNRRELFHAIEGQGAYLNSKRIWVSKVDDISEASSHVGLQYSSELSFKRVTERINRAIEVCRAVRITGSACLDLAYVASGRADIFWEEALKPWDVASGILLVREAGGEVASCLDERFDIFKPDIFATNGSRRLAGQFKEGVLY